MEQLANKIVEKLKKNFANVYLSGNLKDTIKVNKTPNGFEVEIPAKIYDLAKFYKTGAIIYTNNGSYASEVDETGGFSGVHKNYVEMAIYQAIYEWMKENNYNGSVK